MQFTPKERRDFYLAMTRTSMANSDRPHHEIADIAFKASPNPSSMLVLYRTQIFNGYSYDQAMQHVAPKADADAFRIIEAMVRRITDEDESLAFSAAACALSLNPDLRADFIRRMVAADANVDSTPFTLRARISGEIAAQIV